MVAILEKAVSTSPKQYVIASKASTSRRDSAKSSASRLIERLKPVPGKKQHSEFGPAVVEISDDRELMRLREEVGDNVIITPLVKYSVARPPRYPIHARQNAQIRKFKENQQVRTVRFSVVNTDNNPIAGALVVAFFSLRWKSGAKAITDIYGVAEIEVPIVSDRVDVVDVFEVIYIYPPHSLWSTYQVSVPTIDQKIILESLPSITGYEWWTTMLGIDALHSTGNMGKGINVAVIDTGVGPHPDLENSIVHGENFTTDGGPSAYEDVDGHGTHVSGIIGASGQLIGVAPNAAIFAARVFQDGEEGATNSDIAAAIETAVDDWGCNLLNLSLGGPYDPLIEDRINYATRRGVLCVAAAGNSSGSVEYPARLRSCLCVSAVGRLNMYPDGSIHKENEPESMGLLGTDQFYAPRFTCWGSEVVVCAPGVAIISTVPPDRYTALDGTSMACPIVTGVAALLMSSNSELLSYDKASRVGHLKAKIKEALTDIRLPREFQGSGMIRV